ncbi:hypothetical protein L1049_010595 [Liquidambar formosana]|uniref:Uncharacterized protein n=1 Tax=Liquidambar formosana TaxID=63359 RepID=A0AAP0R4Z7_LIQFO
MLSLSYLFLTNLYIKGFCSFMCHRHLQQHHSKQSQQRVVREKKQGISLGRTTPIDQTLLGVPKAILPRNGSRDEGLNEGVNPMPLKGWPLTGIDQIPPGLGHQVLNSLLQVPNQQQQLQMSTAQLQQELLAQILSCTPGKPLSSFPGSSTDLNTHNNLMLPRSDLNGKDGQMIDQMKQAVEHQQNHDQQPQQQIQENDRNRKILSYSGTGDSTLDCKDAEEEKHVDENIESFLSHDENADNTSTPSILKQQSTACNENPYEGFTFEEVGCLHSSKSKVLCCHFSSDGKLLASAGHDKKVLIWNTETFDSVNTSEGHSHLISDVRFRPSSNIFATSSFDRTVQIWDAARPNKSLFKLHGHAEQVTSLDFHPRKMDLLCSCDSNDEIRLWNVNQSACVHISKGATRQVRFQPRAGNLLATAAGNCISIIDVETDNLQFYLKGHVKEIHSIVWDTSGKYIASVSEDSARVWSAMSGGKCIHELHSNGNNFQSCTFHPGYSQFLVIGGYQSLELWNPTESSKTMTVPAHNGFIAALADSPQTEIVASASHDQCVKLWK